MKVLGFGLLLAGWAITIAAVVLLAATGALALDFRALRPGSGSAGPGPGDPRAYGPPE